MSNIVNEVDKLNRLELIAELKMGIYEASYWSFDDLVNLVVKSRLDKSKNKP